MKFIEFLGSGWVIVVCFTVIVLAAIAYNVDLMPYLRWAFGG